MQDELISRQAVLDRIRESIETYHNQYTTDMLNMWGLFTQFIKEMPSVNPQEKTGHWIDDEFGSKCSCCGIYTHLDKFDRPMKFRHCSMCGAKMKVEE